MPNIKIPSWIKSDIPRKKKSKLSSETNKIISGLKLNTVCKEAKCPNIETCFMEKTATFMILGSRCTRSCAFCGVEKGKPEPVDFNEPLKIVEAVKQLKLKHIVITSVTRDDLPDGGAGLFCDVINLLHKEVQNGIIEILIPDFKGNLKLLDLIINAKPAVFNHNIETVPGLYEKIRPEASYGTSLNILRYIKVKSKNIYTKSGLMLGLGETKKEVLSVFRDLRETGCDFLTIGQYFRPRKENFPVVEYVHKEVFWELEQKAREMGFLGVSSGTWVRSSFHAQKMLASCQLTS